jgi:hypothetical protein
MKIAIVFLLSCFFAASAQAQHWGSETLTVFDNLLPEDAGLGIWSDFGPGEQLGYYDNESWTADNYYIGNGHAVGQFQVTAGTPLNAQKYPFAKILGWDYNGTACDPGDTDLGNGWCRVSKDPATVPFTYLPTLADCSDNSWPDFCPGPEQSIPGAFEDGPGNWSQYISSWSVDNLVVEVIGNNIEVDFDPWNGSNEMYPLNTYIITVQINTTSVADGDAHDFDAATVDTASLRLGPGLAQVMAAPLTADSDGDGDTDYIYGFRMEDTGYNCLSNSITISGINLSGDPIVGKDSVTPLDCSQEMEIDVDPFNDPNVIRPNDDYNLTVAILGMRSYYGDAISLLPGGPLYNSSSLSAGTLKFGPAETPANSTPIITDIDGDGYDDMLVNFNVLDAGIACDDTELQITGEKHDGDGETSGAYPLIAFDAIETTDCSTGTCHP